MLALNTHRDSDISSISHAEGLTRPICIADSGSSEHVTLDQRGLVHLLRVKDRDIRTARNDSFPVHSVCKLNITLYSGGDAIPVTVDDVSAVPGIR